MMLYPESPTQQIIGNLDAIVTHGVLQKHVLVIVPHGINREIKEREEKLKEGRPVQPNHLKHPEIKNRRVLQTSAFIDHFG
jgi:hypothetical protein